jgi:hypothetical protein
LVFVWKCTINQSGKGFNKLVYSDALEIEFIDNNIKYSKEQKINIREKL